MRTEKPTPFASAVTRFRSQVGRVRHALASQGLAFRWSLALVAVALLASLGYLAAPVASGSAFLRNGQSFSSGDILTITSLLDAQRIDYRVDDRKRIEVAVDNLEDARTALAKIGPSVRLRSRSWIEDANKPEPFLGWTLG